MAEPNKASLGVPKRQKIKESNRTMFFWIAGMSAVVGFAAVISFFLVQQIAFRNDVISAKNETAKTLDANVDAAQELKQNIRSLETDSGLISAKVDEDQKALQVILDALPADANSLALGSSIQKKLASGIPGLDVESLTVMPTASESPDGEVVVNDSEAVTTENAINFRMIVASSQASALSDLLKRFERSIRVIDIDQLKLERSSKQYTMTIDGHAYYQPPRVIELQKKEVPAR